MAGQKTAEAKLARLRDLVAHARSMQMSASCVVNRAEVLAAIDDVIDNLPDEIAEAQDVIESSRDSVAAGEAEAQRITEEAMARSIDLATETEVTKVAQQKAATIIAEAEAGGGPVPATSHPLPLRNVTRPDVPSPSLDAAAALAADRNGQFAARQDYGATPS